MVEKQRMSRGSGVVRSRATVVPGLALLWLLGSGSGPKAVALAAPAERLDPNTVPKYVTPLVIPPVMDHDGTDPAGNSYAIAVRQFSQQILPGGIWNDLNGRSDDFPATTVWSYGPADDPTPDVAPHPASQFNYPAYTVETTADVPVGVRWINDLVAIDPATGFPYPEGDPNRTHLPHLLAVDQTAHWANPPKDCKDGPSRTDCAGRDATPYTGPVPIVTHVHGAHVDSHSDGYPEAWWLPAASDVAGYATSGSLFDDRTGTNTGTLGFADYFYRNDQPATTLWYHDHSLGMTRLNVYAGPAGFWLVRGGGFDKVKAGNKQGVLPGPAPVAGQTVLALNVPGDPVRSSIREIPIVIQDRSFDHGGAKLFYPDNRAFFEGLNVPGQAEQFPGEGELRIPFEPDPASDILPIWNPEAFFDVMVVNGVSWPSLDVAQARYRFRLLNGCNSRFLNLALEIVSSSEGALVGTEIPFYQIGAEQGFLPQVVKIQTGEATPLPGDGSLPPAVPAADPDQALLLALAERADVIVDFSALPNGTVVRMTNTAPDAPFGGFPDEPADPSTTGQVMQFVVSSSLNGASQTDPTGATPASSPLSLSLKAEKPLSGKAKLTRQLSLNEGASEQLCVELDPDGNLVEVPGNPIDGCPEGSEPFAPKEALLGLVDTTGAAPVGIPLKWTAPGTGVRMTISVAKGDVDVWVTENPTLGQVEDWEIYNFTEDAHPIHLHLVRFQVMSRTDLDGNPAKPVQPWETGFKDTVIAYPGEITRVRAKFDVEGLYVWHCHIVEHEDNEMMRPFVVSP